MYHYIKLKATASTNTYLASVAAVLPSGTIVYTDCQSAGRGQRGNSWEAEPGKTSFSLLLKAIPLEPARQFLISEAVALALLDVLDTFADGFSVKWPNDIYRHDSKISGTLIENALQGSRILHSIIGIGLNVNQSHFSSDAPNPISLCHIIGRETPLEPLLRAIGTAIEKRLAPLTDAVHPDEAALAALHRDYFARLYRADGRPHPFTLSDGTRFLAVITDVRPDGRLILTDAATGIATPSISKKLPSPPSPLPAPDPAQLSSTAFRDLSTPCPHSQLFRATTNQTLIICIRK